MFTFNKDIGVGCILLELWPHQYIAQAITQTNIQLLISFIIFTWRSTQDESLDRSKRDLQGINISRSFKTDPVFSFFSRWSKQVKNQKKDPSIEQDYKRSRDQHRAIYCLYVIYTTIWSPFLISIRFTILLSWLIFLWFSRNPYAFPPINSRNIADDPQGFRRLLQQFYPSEILEGSILLATTDFLAPSTQSPPKPPLFLLLSFRNYTCLPSKPFASTDPFS